MHVVDDAVGQRAGRDLVAAPDIAGGPREPDAALIVPSSTRRARLIRPYCIWCRFQKVALLFGGDAVRESRAALSSSLAVRPSDA